jgi:high-affinity nickel-transport protein
MRFLAAAASNPGFGIGLLLTAFGLGFRHGIDWDHIAAITDITSSQDSPRAGLYFGSLYAVGHATVVFVIGVLAIVLGEKLPHSVDKVMTKIVGVTLLLLGVYVFYSLAKHGRDFRMRSRWMLVFSGVQRGYAWARDHIGRHGEAEVVHVHEHVSAEPFMHHDADEETANGGTGTQPAAHHRTHAHGHKHRMPDDPFMNYGRATAIGVGMLHGFGGETPTQVVIFLTVAGIGGGGAGVAVLAAFLIGLFASNSLITLSSSYGFLKASNRFGIYATVAILTGIFSLTIGFLFVSGHDSLLPALFGG